jgi:hypothetical protein
MIHVKRLKAVAGFFLIILGLLIAFLAFCNFNIFLAIVIMTQSVYGLCIVLGVVVFIIPTVLYLIEKYL